MLGVLQEEIAPSCTCLQFRLIDSSNAEWKHLWLLEFHPHYRSRYLSIRYHGKFILITLKIGSREFNLEGDLFICNALSLNLKALKFL